MLDARQPTVAESMTPDRLVVQDDWSDLRHIRDLPNIDLDRLYAYRKRRLQEQMRLAGVDVHVMVNPTSLRYAVDYATYSLYQSRIPTTYLVATLGGPTIIYGGYADSPMIDRAEPAHHIAFFDAGDTMTDNARLFAQDLKRVLAEIGSDNRRVSLEYVNPSVTEACLQQGLEPIDGVAISEQARLIKSPDEIECIRWAIAVAEHGIAKMKEALKPGVTELQLWGLLNYTNLANHGEWHDGRMLASGSRINPWYQEASQRVIEDGDLVGFDTDMVGPKGYFCDVSRTFHCGPSKPTARQREIYRLAYDEVQHNMALIRPGISFREIQEQSFKIPEHCLENAYACIIHGVGMCDEYPKIIPAHRGANPYDGILEPGMVLTVESYMGPKGERDGVKLEEQVLVTEAGCELLSSYPFEEDLLA
ncbi:MAG: Xaa-Pro peptidase family protein [Ahrensia sp.]|nr:Xaa-Pro peptidase family protein [Ahrensia sp.]